MRGERYRGFWRGSKRRTGVDEDSMNKFSKELIESLTQACEHAEGKASGARDHTVEVPDVRAIRKQLRMSQQEFARVYRIPLATLKNWEQGRRQPDAPAAAYLQVIAKHPRGAGGPRRVTHWTKTAHST